MAWSWRGNTSGTATSPVKSLPMMVGDFSIVNNAASVTTVNVYMITGTGTFRIAPANLSLDAGEMYENTRQIVMLSAEQIKVQVSASVDYDFTINNMPSGE